MLLHPKLTGQILDRFMNATCISRWELTTVTISIYRKFLNNVYVYVCVYVYVYCILYMYIVHICIHAYNCLMLFDYGSETLVPLKQLVNGCIYHLYVYICIHTCPLQVILSSLWYPMDSSARRIARFLSQCQQRISWTSEDLRAGTGPGEWTSETHGGFSTMWLKQCHKSYENPIFLSKEV